MEYSCFISRLKKKFKGPKPGLAAQLKMVPEPRPGHVIYSEVEDNCIKAGVLLLLFLRHSRIYLLFTRRTDKVLHHRDQISFPGGRLEPGESLRNCALRETQEELGVAADGILILGDLTPLYIPPSNYCIYPTVAATETEISFSPHPQEVAEVIEVPLAHLQNNNNILREEWKIRGNNVLVPFYNYQGNKIWGATAMVLAEFLELSPPG